MPKELPQLKEMSNEAKDDLIRELWKGNISIIVGREEGGGACHKGENLVKE